MALSFHELPGLAPPLLGVISVYIYVQMGTVPTAFTSDRAIPAPGPVSPPPRCGRKASPPLVLEMLLFWFVLSRQPLQDFVLNTCR